MGHHLLSLEFAFRDHEIEGDQGVVRQFARAVRAVEQGFLFQKPDEEEGKESSFSLPKSLLPPELSFSPWIAAMAAG